MNVATQINMDCVKNILLFIESTELHTKTTINDLKTASSLAGFSIEDIACSVKQLKEANYIKVPEEDELVIENLTWFGHELLDGIRDG